MGVRRERRAPRQPHSACQWAFLGGRKRRDKLAVRRSRMLPEAQFLDHDRVALWQPERNDCSAHNEPEVTADLEIPSRRLAQKLGAIVIGPRQHFAAQPLLGGFDSKLPRPLDETTNDCVTPDDFVCVRGARFCRRLYTGCLRRDRLAATYECSIYRYREGDQRGAVLCV